MKRYQLSATIQVAMRRVLEEGVRVSVTESEPVPLGKMNPHSVALYMTRAALNGPGDHS